VYDCACVCDCFSEATRSPLVRATICAFQLAKQQQGIVSRPYLMQSHPLEHHPLVCHTLACKCDVGFAQPAELDHRRATRQASSAGAQ
jgi:hypothetical protein